MRSNKYAFNILCIPVKYAFKYAMHGDIICDQICASPKCNKDIQNPCYYEYTFAKAKIHKCI